MPTFDFYEEFWIKLPRNSMGQHARKKQSCVYKQYSLKQKQKPSRHEISRTSSRNGSCSCRSFFNLLITHRTGKGVRALHICFPAWEQQQRYFNFFKTICDLHFFFWTIIFFSIFRICKAFYFAIVCNITISRNFSTRLAKHIFHNAFIVSVF